MVGKTSIIQRFNNPDPGIPLDTISTVGYEFCKKNLKYGDDIVQVHLWDTAGQDKFKSMIPTYFKKAAG
jgi:GTPase SAR1 family protein